MDFRGKKTHGGQRKPQKEWIMMSLIDDIYIYILYIYMIYIYIIYDVLS